MSDCVGNIIQFEYETLARSRNATQTFFLRKIVKDLDVSKHIKVRNIAQQHTFKTQYTQ